jgi:hypothetical protein
VVCPRKKATEGATEKLGGWIPAEFALPATIDGIEAGRPDRGELFRERPDDSREGRLARLTGERG